VLIYIRKQRQHNYTLGDEFFYAADASSLGKYASSRPRICICTNTGVKIRFKDLQSKKLYVVPCGQTTFLT
jgi:hypothetical protein